jgi:hypothetical protein
VCIGQILQMMLERLFFSLLFARRLFNRAFCNCIQGWIYICKFIKLVLSSLGTIQKDLLNFWTILNPPKNNFHICVHLSVLLNEDLICHFVKNIQICFQWITQWIRISRKRNCQF